MHRFLSLLLALPLLATEPPLSFFRVSSQSPSAVNQLTADGWLSLSNGYPGATFVIERSPSLDAPNWEPFARSETGISGFAQIKVAQIPPVPGFALAPGGRFQMGDVLKDHNAISGPVHTVYLSPFLIQAHEVTNQQLRDVYQWALDRQLITVAGLTVLSAPGQTNVLMDLEEFAQEIEYSTNDGFTILPGREHHPAAFVSWFGAVAYCHFRSLIEGRPSSIDLATWSCDFSKSEGYRLPTEAEWEFAARGGYEGLRFPWTHTNVITHSLANYQSKTNVVYDVSPTIGFHPVYGTVRPRSNPVGVFAPNSYGLYDMIGNIFEWVWDRNDARRYSSATQYDPTGPDTGRFAIIRGGSWYTTAERATTSVRYVSLSPNARVQDVGFRVVLPIRPPIPAN